MEIELTQGQKTIIDDRDYVWLKKLPWYASKDHQYNRFYAVCHDPSNNRRILRMHRLILGLSMGDKRQVDHINGNGLDNQRSNLHICSPMENQRNQRPRMASSKYKGVYYSRYERKWKAKIKVRGEDIYLGGFGNEDSAASAYNGAAIKHFGEFAWLNIIPSPRGRGGKR